MGNNIFLGLYNIKVCQLPNEGVGVGLIREGKLNKF